MVATRDNQSGAIQVDGLIDFQRRLKAADAALPRQMRLALNEVAEHIILPEVDMRVARALSDKPSNVARRKGTLENSVRARSQQREGRILFGIGRANNYAAWWEFGGSTKTPRGGGNRLVYKAGRTLYPALSARRTEVRAALDEKLGALAMMLNG